jgi:hypothetical protein
MPRATLLTVRTVTPSADAPSRPRQVIAHLPLLAGGQRGDQRPELRAEQRPGDLIGRAPDHVQRHRLDADAARSGRPAHLAYRGRAVAEELDPLLAQHRVEAVIASGDRIRRALEVLDRRPPRVRRDRPGRPPGCR